MRKFEEVPFDLLAWSDSRFRMTHRRASELLQASVREIGILNPLIVIEGELPGRYVIVTGWLRFLASRANGESSVPCHIFHSVPSKVMLLASLLDNIGHRCMNPVEQSLAVRKLKSFYPESQLREHFFPLLGLSAGNVGEEQLCLLESLADMREIIRDAIADDRMSPEVAAVISRFPHGHSERLVHLLNALECDSTAQLEVAGLFVRLWSDKGIPPTEVILDEEWDWAAPPSEPAPAEKWPMAPEAAGGTMPIPVNLEKALEDLIEDFPETRKTSGDRLRPAGGGHNFLFSGNGSRPAFLPQISRDFSGGPGAGSAQPVSGIPDGPEERLRAVRKALESRLGQLRGGNGAGRYRLHEGAAFLPDDVRLVLKRGRRQAPPAGRVEIRFQDPDHLHFLLRQILEAEERGALFEVLAGKTC